MHRLRPAAWAAKRWPPSRRTSRPATARRSRWKPPGRHRQHHGPGRKHRRQYPCRRECIHRRHPDYGPAAHRTAPPASHRPPLPPSRRPWRPRPHLRSGRTTAAAAHRGDRNRDSAITGPARSRIESQLAASGFDLVDAEALGVYGDDLFQRAQYTAPAGHRGSGGAGRTVGSQECSTTAACRRCIPPT